MTAVAVAGVLDQPATRRHLDHLVRTWLGIRAEAVEAPQLPPHLARLVLRLEEVEQPERDSWGGWPFAASDNFRRGALYEPEIDLWLDQRRAELESQMSLEPRWPRGHRFAVCLTHDVDLVSLSSTPAQALRYARAGLAPGIISPAESMLRFTRPPLRFVRAVRGGIARAPSLRDTLERSLDLERARGATASYFFTVPPRSPRTRYDCVYAPGDRCSFRNRATRIVDVMRTVAEEGFDVGLHGGYAAGLIPNLLGEERAILEAATGLEIRTTRQHFLRWDIRSTPRYQEAAGLRADCTMGFNFNVGFRAGTSLPFRLFDVEHARPLDVIEVPLVAQDGAILGAAGLNLDLEGARALLQRLFAVAASTGGVLTLLVHPDKLARPEWLALYEWALDQALDAGGWLTSVRVLTDWWREREARLVAG